MSENATSADGADRVWYDEMRSAFVGETIERDGVIAEVESVVVTSDDPRDDDARYSLEVRVQSVEAGGDQS